MGEASDVDEFLVNIEGPKVEASQAPRTSRSRRRIRLEIGKDIFIKRLGVWHSVISFPTEPWLPWSKIN